MFPENGFAEKLLTGEDVPTSLEGAMPKRQGGTRLDICPRLCGVEWMWRQKGLLPQMLRQGMGSLMISIFLNREVFAATDSDVQVI